MVKRIVGGVATIVWQIALTGGAWAATSGGWGWEAPLNSFNQAVLGVPVQTIAIAIVIGTAIKWYSGWHGVGFMEMGKAVMAIALMVFAIQIINNIGWAGATF